MKKVSIWMAVVMLTLLSLTACSKTNPTTKATTPKEPDPVTLNVLWTGDEKSFNDRIANDIIKKQLPYVTAKFYSSSKIDDVLATGVKIDVMNITNNAYYDMKRYQLNYDMTALIKTQNFDLTRFIPESLEAIRRLSQNGRMDAVPDKAYMPYAFYGMLYNKDIFDKFGVPYPTDNMSWDQVLDLAKRLTRTDNGIKYAGIGLPPGHNLYKAFDLSFTNANGKADLSNPLFPKILQMYKDAYQLTGRLVKDSYFTRKEYDVAMWAGSVEGFFDNAPARKDTYPNWDLVSFPHFTGMPVTVPPNYGLYAVASTSEHKKDAMKLIDALLSKENMKQQSDVFMNSEVISKHVEALNIPKQAIYVASEYDSAAFNLLNNKIDEMDTKNLDVNTVIASFQDELQKQINELQK